MLFCVQCIGEENVEDEQFVFVGDYLKKLIYLQIFHT